MWVDCEVLLRRLHQCIIRLRHRPSSRQALRFASPPFFFIHSCRITQQGQIGGHRSPVGHRFFFHPCVRTDCHGVPIGSVDCVQDSTLWSTTHPFLLKSDLDRSPQPMNRHLPESSQPVNSSSSKELKLGDMSGPDKVGGRAGSKTLYQPGIRRKNENMSRQKLFVCTAMGRKVVSQQYYC